MYFPKYIKSKHQPTLPALHQKLVYHLISPPFTQKKTPQTQYLLPSSHPNPLPHCERARASAQRNRISRVPLPAPSPQSCKGQGGGNETRGYVLQQQQQLAPGYTIVDLERRRLRDFPSGGGGKVTIVSLRRALNFSFRSRFRERARDPSVCRVFLRGWRKSRKKKKKNGAGRVPVGVVFFWGEVEKINFRGVRECVLVRRERES